MTGTARRARLHPADLAELLGLPTPTAEQQAVITAPLAPAAVVAGAGSGKTETMSSRVVWLVANGHAAPDRILGLTFTNKAAAELSARVRARLGQLRARLPELAVSAPGEPTVMTYHAYAGQLVGEHALRIAVEPTARLLTQAMTWQFAERVVHTYEGDLPNVDNAEATVVGWVLDLAAELAEHLRGPDDLREWTARFTDVVTGLPRGNDLPGQPYAKVRQVLATCAARVELMPLVERYERAKRAAGAMDFGDQMSLAARIAQRCPEAGRSERLRYPVVLLDEYQDTGHGQLVMLRSLFGGGHPVTAVGDPCQSIYGWRGASAGNLTRFPQHFPDRRGRPAAVLPLGTSFRNDRQVLDVANALSGPLREGGVRVGTLTPGPASADGEVRCALLSTVDDEAEWVAEQVGEVWAADAPARALGRQGRGIAVLARRRAQFTRIERALSARGIPVELVGLGGLLSTPEVRDVVCTLRVISDPTAGNALMRLLTGPRWRIGPRDLVALGARARELVRERPGEHADQNAGQPGQPSDGPVRDRTGSDGAGRDRVVPDRTGHGGASPSSSGAESTGDSGFRGTHCARAAVPAEGSGPGLWTTHSPVDNARTAGQPPAGQPPTGPPHAGDLRATGPPHAGDVRATATSAPHRPGEPEEEGSIVEALDDLGPPERYSPEGHRRLDALRRELAALRRRTAGPLTDLVADVERTLRLDVELAAHAEHRRAHLDRFLDVAAQFAEESEVATVGAFLAYLTAAETQERGLEAGATVVDDQRVQILTVHAAKGLEWDVVAVPGLSVGVFPDRDAVSGSGWATSAGTLPFALRGDAEDLPDFEPSAADDQKQLDALRQDFVDRCRARGELEERRLAYVAVTRARQRLLCSGYWWDEAVRPRGPSVLLDEVRAACVAGAGTVTQWVGRPAEEEANPLLAKPPEATWPTDPLGRRRRGVAQGAALVRAALDNPRGPAPPTGQGELFDPNGEAWEREVDLLLAERARRFGIGPVEVALPGHLSVSALVALRRDPAALAAQIRRPMPFRPAPLARRGTAFHAWLEQRFAGERLLDLDELPGAADEDHAPDEDLEVLRAAFLDSPWADRRPVEVEVPFEAVVGHTLVRGRMDAVFRDGDGGYDVVDWKTGARPHGAAMRAAAVQLAAYRLAWAELAEVPVLRVRAAFHYVRSNETFRPADLLDADGLRALLEDLPAPRGGG